MDEQIEVFETQDGSHSLIAHRFGVSYHSRYGAIQESMHVFIRMGLHALLPGHHEMSVLEIGFGSGLNALLTLMEARRLHLKVNYQGVEAFPVSIEQASMLNYPEQLGDGGLREDFMRMHQSPWDETLSFGPHFSMRKRLQRFQDIDDPPTFHLVYFDAFAPEAQPELWELPVLSSMYNAMVPQGILVTYCAKGAFKRRLKDLGFIVEALPGPPGKREMTRATKP